MNSMAARLIRSLRLSNSRLGVGLQGCPTLHYSSSAPFNGGNDGSDGAKSGEADGFNDDDFLPDRSELQLQSVDPRKGWNFRGVHKAIICGKVGQAPLQKILRNGKTVTIFTVGTGGMFDQRLIGDKDLPKPAQWHRIAVHNEALGAYAVQQLAKNSSVYVEGDIETRVYNDSINGEVKNIPEICVRYDVGLTCGGTEGVCCSNLVHGQILLLPPSQFKERFASSDQGKPSAVFLSTNYERDCYDRATT